MAEEGSDERHRHQCSIFGKTEWITPPKTIFIFILKKTKTNFFSSLRSKAIDCFWQSYCAIWLS